MKVPDTGFGGYISQAMLGHAEVTKPQLFFIIKTHFSIHMKSHPNSFFFFPFVPPGYVVIFLAVLVL